MHEANDERSQPLIEFDPPEPVTVEPRKRRVLLDVPMRIGTVTVRVAVQIVAMRAQVIVQVILEVILEVERMSAGDAHMNMSRADRAPHPRQSENAEQYQHDADREFHR